MCLGEVGLADLQQADDAAGGAIARGVRLVGLDIAFARYDRFLFRRFPLKRLSGAEFLRCRLILRNLPPDNKNFRALA